MPIDDKLAPRAALLRFIPLGFGVPGRHIHNRSDGAESEVR
jgi:hypothetical protein